MNWDYYFMVKVLEPYRVDELLTPKKIGKNEIDNVCISDLRVRLDNCFDEIDSYILKEKLIEFIDDYWYRIATNIISQKRIVKSIKKNIKLIKKEKPNLDIDVLEDEKILNEVNLQESLLGQEEFILMYFKEQRHFLRNWVAQKSTEFRELPEKEKIRKERNDKETKKLLERVKENSIYKNKYPNVFLNAKAYLIFKDYSDKITKYHLSEYSFLYRVMYDKGLICNKIKESDYRKWLGEEFDQNFIKIKMLHSMEINHRTERFKTLMNKYKPYS
ncbi:MAG: hypothetical protein JXQ93_04820 [Flavobacteriaceae bacterium]